MEGFGLVRFGRGTLWGGGGLEREKWLQSMEHRVGLRKVDEGDELFLSTGGERENIGIVWILVHKKKG